MSSLDRIAVVFSDPVDEAGLQDAVALEEVDADLTTARAGIPIDLERVDGATFTAWFVVAGPLRSGVPYRLSVSADVTSAATGARLARRRESVFVTE